MRKSIAIIGIIVLIVGGFFTVLRAFARPPESAMENLFERLLEQFPDMIDEELRQLLEGLMGRGGIFGYLNWILLAIGGIVTAVGSYSSSKQEATEFKMGY